MRLLIDAYNLLFRTKKTTRTLQEARKKLVDEMSALLSTRTFDAALVFDSCDTIAEVHPTRSEAPPIEVIYSPQGKSADCYIVELVEIAKYPSQVTVVSSDGHLCRRVKALGAHTMSVEHFLKMVHKKRGSKKENQPHMSEKELLRLESIFEERLHKTLPPDDDHLF